ncbi:unnamed protein product [Gemmata massiliana]|uniref:Uncharacterized protein n=1 Tax=Gemmata massiliana TaxID=1210884 RepID=A0A6P2D6P2_9BACT|nr:hypothetical protein [Gemmata massiliana]VTR95804.1 unnamed protein product [Gemmata massiliana]
MNPDRPEHVTLIPFAAAFVPFAVLVSAALVVPEFGRELDLGRTRLTIWATTILLLPAVVLYPFRSVGRTTANLAHLYWTVALAAYLFHVWWAVAVVFDGITETVRGQGTLIAGVNFFLTGVWGIDAALLWAVPRPGPILVGTRLVARVFIFLVFAYTLLVLRGGAAQVLGAVFTVLAVVALTARMLAHSPAPEPAPAPPARHA